MPIISNNNVVIKKQESEVTSNPVESQDINNSNIDDKEHFVYVNGKKKKIGKKSQYLLDMLTIEDQ